MGNKKIGDWLGGDKPPPDQPMPQGSPGQINPYTPPYVPPEYDDYNYPDPIQNRG